MNKIIEYVAINSQKKSNIKPPKYLKKVMKKTKIRKMTST